MAQVDFYTMLSGLGDTIAAKRKDNLRREALSSINNPDGTVDFGRAILGLTRAGDVEGAARIQQLANAAEDRRFRQATDARDAALARERFDFDKSQAAAGRTPPGWMRGADGNLTYQPKGPADPEYIAAANEAKTKPRSVSIGDIRKLSEEGGKYANVAGFGDTFDDKYAGYKSQWVGETANLAGRSLPEGVVGKDMAAGADWWQSYDRYKNIIRNDQFGSALTATEKKAFEQADINPGMDPNRIRTNLKRQKEIIEGSIAREAGAMIEAGYDPQVIGKSYGIDLKKFGIEPKKRGGAPTAGPSDTLQRARDAIARGADRNAVIKRLVDAGIKPEGL